MLKNDYKTCIYNLHYIECLQSPYFVNIFVWECRSEAIQPLAVLVARDHTQVYDATWEAAARGSRKGEKGDPLAAAYPDT